MAVDEALLEAARLSRLTALRFYRWSEPTLSLGYFQKQLPDVLPDDLLRLPRIRRLSGGGAILHHHEWTYSCALPPLHPLASEPLKLYELVHEKIIECLSGQGIPAALRGTPTSENSHEPFLCFGREDPRDIVLGPHKILGSAQRRRRGAVLQHGSLLVKRSPFAPSYPGLCDLTGQEIPISDWIPNLAKRMAQMLSDGEDAQAAGELPTDIVEMARTLERKKYQQSSWR
jgi:lipoate-protein ligase A